MTAVPVFDIDHPLLDGAALEAVRRKYKARRTALRVLIPFALPAGAILGYRIIQGISGRITSGADVDSIALGLLVLALTFALAIIATLPMSLLMIGASRASRIVDQCTPVHGPTCRTALDLAQQDPALEAYRTAVAQARVFVNGDILAMKAALKARKAEVNRADNAAACAALHAVAD